MKKYFIYLLLILSSTYLHANDTAINECKSDIYFANGIMTDEGNATKNRDLIRDNLLIEQYNGDLSKINKELNFKTAYNNTYGFSGDIYEAYLQLAGENEGWRDLYLFISYILGNTGDEKDWYNQALSLITGMNEEMIRQAYEADLSVQITDYKNSIALGHSVIVVAHSQGNLFTNDAYKNITIGDGAWRKAYFTAVAVASPATKLLEENNKDPHIGFDNDPVAYLGTLGTTQNPNRSYKYRNALGELVENSFDVQFHSFDYYMGEDILFHDGIGERKVSTDIGRVIIMSFLQEAIQNHRDAPSQWETTQEYGKDTCDYKITVKHRYDPHNITMDDPDTMVYPFAPNKKLYQAKDENGVFQYLKASCGGENILSEWDGKKENECWLINNPQEEKIAIENDNVFYAKYQWQDKSDGWRCLSIQPFKDRYFLEPLDSMLPAGTGCTRGISDAYIIEQHLINKSAWETRGFLVYGILYVLEKRDLDIDDYDAIEKLEYEILKINPNDPDISYDTYYIKFKVIYK